MLSMLSMMASGGAAPTPRVQLTGATLFNESLTTTDAEVGYQINADGFEKSYEGIGGAYGNIDYWLLSGAAADYDCMLEVTGDPVSGSASGTWLTCGSSQAWTITDTGVAGPALTNTCTISIRDATTLVVLASATVTM